jgi:hypothetical protein
MYAFRVAQLPGNRRQLPAHPPQAKEAPPRHRDKQLSAALEAGAQNELVAVDMRGTKQLTYAPQSKAGPTQLETLSLVLAAEGQQADKVVEANYKNVLSNT